MLGLHANLRARRSGTISRLPLMSLSVTLDRLARSEQVCPASTLHNWKDEICNFVPDLKLLPYWGNVAERKTLRRWLDNKKLYRHDSHFQVVLTSYQLLVSDEKHFRPVKWQYLVLDEAQVRPQRGWSMMSHPLPLQA